MLQQIPQSNGFCYKGGNLRYLWSRCRYGIGYSLCYRTGNSNPIRWMFRARTTLFLIFKTFEAWRTMPFICRILAAFTLYLKMMSWGFDWKSSAITFFTTCWATALKVSSPLKRLIKVKRILTFKRLYHIFCFLPSKLWIPIYSAPFLIPETS